LVKQYGFGDQTKINTLDLINQKGDDLTLIQHFGTTLVLVLLYGNGTNQQITLMLT
jgi:hypothetical protein